MCAHVLLQMGSDPNYFKGSFTAPLIKATEQRSLQMIKKLLKFGANPNIQDNQKNTPLHCLFNGFNTQPEKSKIIANLLMKAGANPNCKNKNLWAPIHMACYFNQVEAIKWLLNYNKTKSNNKGHSYNLNHQGGKPGVSPLQISVIQGHSNLAELFLNLKQVNIFQENVKMQSAKQIAHIKSIQCQVSKKEQTFLQSLYQKKHKRRDHERQLSLNMDKVNRMKSGIKRNKLNLQELSIRNKSIKSLNIQSFKQFSQNSFHESDQSYGKTLKKSQSKPCFSINQNQTHNSKPYKLFTNSIKESHSKNNLTNLLKNPSKQILFQNYQIPTNKVTMTKRNNRQLFKVGPIKAKKMFQFQPKGKNIEITIDYMCGTDENDIELTSQKTFKILKYTDSVDNSQYKNTLNEKISKNDFCYTQNFESEIDDLCTSEGEYQQEFPFQMGLLYLDDEDLTIECKKTTQIILNKKQFLGNRLKMVFMLKSIFFKIINNVKRFKSDKNIPNYVSFLDRDYQIEDSLQKLIKQQILKTFTFIKQTLQERSTYEGRLIISQITLILTKYKQIKSMVQKDQSPLSKYEQYQTQFLQLAKQVRNKRNNQNGLFKQRKRRNTVQLPKKQILSKKIQRKDYINRPYSSKSMKLQKSYLYSHRRSHSRKSIFDQSLFNQQPQQFIQEDKEIFKGFQRCKSYKF